MAIGSGFAEAIQSNLPAAVAPYVTPASMTAVAGVAATLIAWEWFSNDMAMIVGAISLLAFFAVMYLL